MQVVSALPHPIKEIENTWITMPDGCRLAARIWMPQDAARTPVPAILEYIPYRKRDFTRGRDEPMHRYFAGHGYAVLRVDVRGSGDSDGILVDEYVQQEQDDAVEVIRWIAAQPWCNGAVGMMGKSWGGFNSLQVAALQPPALKAIITVCSTDDRYADDAHYMGGCLLDENLTWGSVLLTFNAYPPDPEVVGARWRRMWLERLEHAVLFPEAWLRHQRRDAYWKHGSVCEAFDRIRCPVYAIGGWADAYTNAIPRLLAGLLVPRKGLVGPWAHVYPHNGIPGPAIGFLQEALRWWDQWLKGMETGIMAEPMYRVWMQESLPPRAYYATRPGRWVAEATWPSPRIAWHPLYLNEGRLDDREQPESNVSLRSPQTIGMAGGDWCGFGEEGEMSTDQRDEDARSLAFDSGPLHDRLEILGAPVAALELTVDKPSALLAVRLNDVAPDGASTRVTYGLFNLTHRESHEYPTPLEPGKRYAVRVQLNDIAHAFPAGHRLRLAISTCYWPVAWPSPEPATLTLHAGASVLNLPVRPSRAEDDALPPFARVEAAPSDVESALGVRTARRSVERDDARLETIYTIASDEGDNLTRVRVEPIQLDIAQRSLKRYIIRDDDPLSAQAEVEHITMLRRNDWSTRIETHTRLTSSSDVFRLHATLDAYEQGTRIFSKRWDRSVPRDLV